MHRVIFVTFSTDKQWILPLVARQVALNTFVQENGSSAEMHAVVIMPDHVHLLLTPSLQNGLPIPLAEIMRLLKGRSARAVNLLLNRTGRVWQ